MKHFTKLFVAIAMMMVAISANAKVEQVHATFANPAPTGNASWDAATKTFGWSATSWNQLKGIGLPSGDLSQYKKLVIDCKITQGNRFRVLFYQGSANKTLYCQDGLNVFFIADTLKAIAPDDYNSFIKDCTEICLSGDNGTAPGSAIINDVYLETYNDEGEKTYADFASPAPTGNASWDAATNTFGWSATSWNQLKNIGLPSGDLSMYKKLVIDCKITQGNRFRVLFYQGSANKTLYCQDGLNVFFIADTLKAIAPDDYNSFIKDCTEICLSGDNGTAPGSAIINSVYLETYPENESVDIPDFVEEQDPGRPDGNFVDLTTDMYNANTTSYVQQKRGKGDYIYGVMNKDNYADLSAYNKMTIIATPGTPLTLTFNHEVDEKEALTDYAEADAGKYVWIDAVVGEDGKYEVDLSQYDVRHLNYIRIPWGYEKQSYIWYILLTKDEPIFDFNAMDVALSSNDSNDGDITTPAGLVRGGVSMTISVAEEGKTANRYWGTAKGPQLRMYSGCIVMDAPEGKAITKVEVDNGRWNADNAFNGTIPGLGEWTGNSTNVVLAIAGNTQMNKIIVTLADKNDETTTYEELPTAINTAKAAAVKGEVFNLAGQKLAAPVKGFNIIDGKKVLVK